VQFDKAKSWNWSGNVVQDVATSGVTSVPEEAMLLEAEPIDLVQAMNNSNWLEEYWYMIIQALFSSDCRHPHKATQD
jgi:hypothetical protein